MKTATRQTLPILMCLLLVLFGSLCPAYCMTQSDTHSCCHTKTSGSHAKQCGHTGMAPARGPLLLSTMAVQCLNTEEYRDLPRAASYADYWHATTASRTPLKQHQILRL